MTLSRSIRTLGLGLAVALWSGCQASQQPHLSSSAEVKPGGPDEERLTAAFVGRAPRPLGQRAARMEVEDDAALDHDVIEPNSAPRPLRPLTIGPRMTARCRQLRPALERAAQAGGLDPYLVLALAWVESGFEPSASSPVGARGVMQLMPTTSAAFGCDDPDEVRCGARAAVSYVQHLLRRFDGDLVYALCAYETGTVAALKARRQGTLPVNLAYAERVLEARARLERSGCEGR